MRRYQESTCIVTVECGVWSVDPLLIIIIIHDCLETLSWPILYIIVWFKECDTSHYVW